MQLIGIYPAGNLVRLNTGEVAVVREGVRAGSVPARRSASLIDRDGKRLELPYELNLWETAEDPRAVRRRSSRRSTRRLFGFDPLMLM